MTNIANTGPVFARPSDDAVAGLCGVWMIAGLFVDGWAHRNQRPETFFTPWHAILYSGFAASAVWMLYVVRRHQQPGQSLRRALPVGYGFRSLGVAVFGMGAIGDLIWHQLLGVEVNIEALLSPTHLVLLTGGLLMAAGPIVSTLAREHEQLPRWSSTGPIVGTVAFVVALLQFFVMYLSPYAENMYGRNIYGYAVSDGGRWLRNQLQIQGIAGILVFTFITTGALLFLARRVRLPRGTFVVVLVVPALLQTVLDSFGTLPRLIGAVVAALLAELTWPAVESSPHRRFMLPAWIGGLTAITWFGLVLGVAIDPSEGGVAWTAPLWTGVPFLAALFAALLTVVTDPQ
jgi:hypothetical protein